MNNSIPFMVILIILCSVGCGKDKPSEKKSDFEVVVLSDGAKQIHKDPDYSRAFKVEAYSVDNNKVWNKMGSWDKTTLPYNNSTGFWIFNEFESKNEIQIPSDWNITITQIESD